MIHLFCPCDEIIFVNGFYTNGELLLKLDSYFQLWHKKNIDEPILDPYIWAEIPLDDISSFRNSLCLMYGHFSKGYATFSLWAAQSLNYLL